ncbi:MAG: hypothetical protein CL431_10730 [Acidimicrobiaceae bacterium]|nr:hypothetical protein [Acidimicrobiaceae bacterium]|tara:strand:+ start:3935 stop:8074 length:4140 start_codon:yes stop_codon:yes gene_type:complete
MAAATGTVVISQAGGSFDSATYPRFVLGDGTNNLTFVIDNNARGLLDSEGNDAKSGDYTGGDATVPLEDPQKGRLVVPTFDEADGAKKALLAFEMTDQSNFNTWAINSSLNDGGGLAAITTIPHFIFTDASGSTMKVGIGAGGGSNITSNGTWSLVAKYGSSSSRYWLYKKASVAEYWIRVIDSSGNDWRLHTALMQAVNHANNASLINIEAYGATAAGTLQQPSSIANDTYTSSESNWVIFMATTAGFAGNACSMNFVDGTASTGLSTDARKKSFKWGYDEYLASDSNINYYNHHSTSPTNDQFWGKNFGTPIYFRQGTIAGSGSDASLSTANIAEAIKDMVNASILGITATRSSSTVSLTNDTDGSVGNVTITTTNEGSLFSVTGMSNAASESGGSTAMRTTISAKQLALSSSGGISAYTGSSDQPSLKMDISALAALGASPASGDFIPVHDITTAGSVKKITVAELIGSVAAGSDTQVQFNDGGSSLGGDAGLTYNKTSDTLSVGNDLKLTSDSAILSLGAGDDATLTHDGTTGLTIAASPISIDSTGELHLNSTTGDVKFQDGGTDQLALDLDGTAGAVIMKLMVDSDDFVFQQYDGTEVFRVEDDGAFDIAGGAGSTGVTISAAGAITVDGISTLGATTGATVSAAGVLNVNNATDATSATDGSLQTDGGLSVVKDIIAGNDVKLLSDSAVLALGAGSDVTITHDGSTGATLASAGAFIVDGAAAVTVDSDAALTLGGASIDMDADGGAVAIDGTGGVSLGTATSGVAVSIGHSTSETTVNDNLTVTGNHTVTGNLTVNGTTVTVNSTTVTVDDPIITLGGDSAPGSDDNKDRGVEFRYHDGSSARVGFMGWDDSAEGFAILSAATNSSEVFSGTAAPLVMGALTATAVGASTGTFSGVLKTDDATEATSTTDGSLQTDGGLSVAKSAVIGDDLDLLSDGAILNFGAGQDVNLTHVHDTGLLLNSSRQLQFGDSGTYIHQSADGVLDLVSDTEIEINATTVDINGAIDASSSITAAGRVIVDDTTEATSTTDGSMQTDGGLSVAKSVVIGDDLDLLSNSAIFKVGSDQPFTLTHANSSNTATVSSGHKLAFGDAGDYISGDGTDLLLVSSADVKVTGDLIPSADDTYDLGTTSAAWQDLHLEGDIKAQDAMEIDTAAGAITIDGAEGVDIQEGGTSVITIDTNRDVLFASTGGSSGDPDVEFDGYTRFDGTAEFDGSVDIDGAVSLDNASVTFSALADLTNSSVASGDKFVIQDADASGVAKEITFDHVAEKMAGAGLANSSGVLSIAHHQDTFISGGGTAGNAGRIFTMTATPASADAVSVYVNGLLQARSGSYTANGFNGERDYNISGTTLTLVSSNALAAGDELVVRFIKT